MRNGRGADARRMDLGQSPIHRVVWDSEVPLELFTVEPQPMPPEVRARLERSLDIVRRHRRAGTLYDARGPVSDQVLTELGAAGYWGLRADPRHGGAGASFAVLTQAITEMTLADPYIAGMSSTQAGLGPVSSLEDFGTEEQKARLLPPLARGERLGCFAITEPGTSSDWGQIRTTARRDGARLFLSGEKLFISNAAPGRTLSLLCKVDGRFEQLIVELPWRQDEHFEIVEYGLRAPAHVANVGLRFRELEVPTANMLVPPFGDGAMIARRALNHGRTVLSAIAAGLMRRFAGTLIPWVQRRATFGAAIATRELVERRLGRLAARIVACDALTGWGAGLLDQGYRGELECVMAKVVSTELLNEATIDILLKTLGARSFLPGNDFADSIHDLLAPAIYEGENEILTLGFLAGLGKAHSAQALAPIRDAVHAAGFARTDLSSARQLWAARRPLASYAAWLAEREARQLSLVARRSVPSDADGQTELAGQVLRGAALEISRMVRRGGPEAAARQALGHDIATRVQWASALLVVNRYAARQTDPLVRSAGLCMGMELGHALLGVRPSARYLQLLTELGAAVAQDRFAPVASAERGAIPMAEHLPSTEDMHPELPLEGVVLH